MSDEERFISQVRSHRMRAEPISSAGTLAPERLDARRPTTRFRLERVSLLPFIPASLIAYVERARTRRHVRFAIAFVTVVSIAVLGFVGARMGKGNGTTTQGGVKSSGRSDHSVSLSIHTSAQGPDVLTAQDLAPPLEAHTQPPKLVDAAPKPAPRSSVKPHNDVPRSAAPKSSATPPAWWW